MADFLVPPPPPTTPLGRWRILSPKAGVRVSPFFLGGGSLGSAWEKIAGPMTKEKAFELLDAFYEAGGNAIDLANNYQNDESEIWVGEWIKKREAADPKANFRDQLVITSKYTASYKSYALGKNAARTTAGNSKKSLHVSLKDSLTKLQTDYVDILYLHWWDFSTSIEELMDSLDIVVKSGKVLYLGISDTPAWVVSAANVYASSHGKTPFSIYQGRWNVMIRDFERDILPMAKMFGMAIAPWDAAGGGRIKSVKQVEEKKKSGEALRSFFNVPELQEEEIKFSAVLTKIAEVHQVESPSVIALAYILNKAPNVFPIVGGRKVEYLHQNIKALSIKLTAEQVKEIEAVKPFDLGFPHNFLGGNPAEGPNRGLIANEIANIDYVQSSRAI